MEIKDVIKEYRREPGSVSDAALKAAINSQLPGRANGPADAYRHLIWAGELTRRYGENLAVLGVNLHETSVYKKGSKEEEQHKIDNHNNKLGVEIGKKAKTWEEVKEMAKEKISRSSGNGKSDDLPIWMDSEHWSSNPRDENKQEIPTTELRWPDPSWRDEDKRPDIEDEGYSKGGIEHRHSGHKNPDEKPLSVREELEKNYRVEKQKAEVANQNAANSNTPRAPSTKASSGGTVHVKAYDREGGTEHVRSHTRKPPVE
ncbi:MAG: hypothetical protein EYC62_05795 [Alphaproteobacteria bacterium]|nr:MAG: hypothetical protein EYC62_05795 [Alphaproteobacteria bacterium]